MNGYEMLANAVVEQAADDYRHALIEQKKWSDKLEELEQFFTGENISLYTKLDGVTLMEDIKQDVIDNNYSKKSEHMDKQERKEKKLKKDIKQNLLRSITLLEKIDKIDNSNSDEK